jgi:hypothetical protein
VIFDLDSVLQEDTFCLICLQTIKDGLSVDKKFGQPETICSKCFGISGIHDRKPDLGRRINRAAEKKRKEANLEKIRKLMLKICLNLGDDQIGQRFQTYDEEIKRETDLAIEIKAYVKDLELEHSQIISNLNAEISKLRTQMEGVGTASRWFGGKYKELSRQHSELCDQVKAHEINYRDLGSTLRPSEEKSLLLKTTRTCEGRIRQGASKIAQYEMAKKVLIKVTKAIGPERKKEQVRAAASAHFGELRGGADNVKRKLKVTELCPYCEGDLGKNYEADHIYPVSKGGLSTTTNMVNICKRCNQKKSGLTLRRFCERSGYNEQEISRRLNALGKDF